MPGSEFWYREVTVLSGPHFKIEKELNHINTSFVLVPKNNVSKYYKDWLGCLAVTAQQNDD